MQLKCNEKTEETVETWSGTPILLFTPRIRKKTDDSRYPNTLNSTAVYIQINLKNITECCILKLLMPSSQDWPPGSNRLTKKLAEMKMKFFWSINAIFRSSKSSCKRGFWRLLIVMLHRDNVRQFISRKETIQICLMFNVSFNFSKKMLINLNEWFLCPVDEKIF